MRYEKWTTLVYRTLLYVLQTEVAKASDENKVAVLGPTEKKNICEIIINDLLLLAISTKNIELVLYASEMFRFI